MNTICNKMGVTMLTEKVTHTGKTLASSALDVI